MNAASYKAALCVTLGTKWVSGTSESLGPPLHVSSGVVAWTSVPPYSHSSLHTNSPLLRILDLFSRYFIL